ncbi:putative membrane-associated protein [Desulfosporosinus orientis DSM 765]|uniref:Putative membrane-associated protein n=1 Tax=Desulfosporosinus orientis (strain ATCC 19365 / DSM 765 / NCIMB 8382 / VKM B-1628 / Singapore I) TaxID=768706 RepID=G7WD48_DESOD|nr:VTT domain-containing protein [Desulfosporosinus orientis]AET67243.1 putative membrane-associated protein [Desulfosporosinus orientis DSM 765]
MTSTLLIHYITQYGYTGLYFILGISILGIPIPDETLLIFVGFLTYSGKLNPVLAILSAAAGSATGITVAYFLGTFFQQKVLTHLKKHAGAARLEKVLNWYHRHGGKLLTIGYFVPGVRHLSGYVAGLSRLSYRNFAMFAYLGATLWTSSFIIIGRLLGSQWESLLPLVHRYALIVGIIALFIAVAFYLLYRNHSRLVPWLYQQISLLPKRYQSLGRRRFIAVLGGLAFLALFIILMGLIQDLVFHEVGEFDTLVVAWLVGNSPNTVIQFMQIVNALGTHLAVLIVFLVSVPILHLTRMHWTHAIPLVLAWAGGTLVDLLFRLVFRGEPIHIFENLLPFYAPTTGFLLAAITFYAVLGYILVRNRSFLIQMLILIFDLILITLLALSPVYLRVHAPSAMVTGLTVSGLLALTCMFVYEYKIYKEEV